MELDPEFCYRAILSRDPRFDGRFFTAVVTTGIYCRSVCPAPKPKRKKVLFFSTAAAAEKEGFQPCLRCKPEAAPAISGWPGLSETLMRAMNLIDAGFLDERNVSDLAGQFQMSERHLRRLFEEQIGATPVSIALTRRLHFARKLLEQTALPVIDVAFASGFSSLRRFNSAFKNAYSISPSDLRKQDNFKPHHEHNLQFKLAYRPPFHWNHLIGFLRNRAIENVEWVDADCYRRTISVAGSSGILEVHHLPEQHSVVLSIPISLSRSIMQIVESVKRIFDLKADPAAIQDAFMKDRVMASIINKVPGLRVPGAWNWFEIAVRAILGQQITVKAAKTIAGRLVQKFGTPLDGNQNSDKLFPLPEQILNASLTGLGIPTRRVDAIRQLAQAAVDSSIGPDCGIPLEETIRRFCLISGIGPWTAHYIALRAFGELDVFLPGDLVLRRTASRLIGKNLTDLELLKHAERWRPWRSYAVLYLWASS